MLTEVSVFDTHTKKKMLFEYGSRAMDHVLTDPFVDY